MKCFISQYSINVFHVGYRNTPTVKLYARADQREAWHVGFVAQNLKVPKADRTPTFHYLWHYFNSKPKMVKKNDN